MAEQVTQVLGIVGISNKGEYSADAYYEKLNVVTYNGSSYSAKTDVHGIVPTNTDYWQLLASKGDTGSKGETGDTGQDGHTPVKGVDYYTAADKAELESTLANDVTTEVSNQLDDLTSATPLAASSTSGMTDTTRIYVNTTDGHWYWYNGTTWVDGGAYQASVDTALSITNIMLRDAYLNNIIGKNLYNKSSYYNKKGKYFNTQYVLRENYYISHPILVHGGLTYCFTAAYNNFGTSSGYYAYIDKDYNIIATYQGTINSGHDKVTFTAPTDGYIILNLGSDSYDYKDTMVLSLENDYTNLLKYELINNDIQVSLNKANDKLDIKKLNDNINSINLFDRNSNMNIKNKYIGNNGYVDSSSNTLGISHPIYLYKDDTIHYFQNIDVIGTNKVFCKCDSNGDYESSIPNNAITLVDGICTYTIKEDGFYRFNVLYDNSNYEYMLVKNTSYPESFIEYKNEIINTYIPYLDDKISKIGTNVSPLFEKSISFNGDSVCAGAGYAGGYGKIIADMYNMQYQNIAVGGGTIASNQYTQNNNPRFWINEHVIDMNSNSDYAIVEGGVNDASLGVPLGTISNGYDAELDTSTYYGAFENMLKQLITRFAGKKYGYIAVHQMTANYRIINDPNTSYYYASKKCCEKWGVPFLDLNDKVPPFTFLRNTSLSSLPTTYTKDGDGWHPNELGYKKYYVDKIISWLENL